MCVTWVSLEIHVCHMGQFRDTCVSQGQSTDTRVSHGSVYSYMCVTWVSLQLHVCLMGQSRDTCVSHGQSADTRVSHGQSADTCVSHGSVCWCATSRLSAVDMRLLFISLLLFVFLHHKIPVRNKITTKTIDKVVIKVWNVLIQEFLKMVLVIFF